jgi:hypothetical protein
MLRTSLVISVTALIIVAASVGLGLLNFKSTPLTTQNSATVQNITSANSSVIISGITVTRSVTPPPLSLEDRFGPVVGSLSVAQSYINSTSLNASVTAAIREPTSVPTGISLIEIRAETGSVALVYNGTGLTSLENYSTKVSMIIAMQQYDSSYYVPNSTYVEKGILTKNLTTTTEVSTLYVTTVTNPAAANITLETINGHPGWGGYGFLEWWAYGIHYSMVADLPLSSLVKVADSM